jgi:FAD/FMN-containing dehydrogenase
MDTITLRTNKEIKNLQNFIDQITTTLPSSIKISTSIGGSETFYNHYENSQIFNTRIQTNPFVIVYCENELDVITTYNTATKNELPIRVRAGGHDHEGECSGTNTIVIDVSKINHIKVDPKTKIASIGPGINL